MNITLLIFYCLIITITPGPTNIMILSTVQNKGVREGMRFACGALAAFGILILSSVFLNSLLAAIVDEVVFGMQFAGCAYILFLAYKVFRMSSQDYSADSCISFRSAFLMQFLNPKVVIFTMTVIPGFVMPYYASYAVLTAFAVLITVIALFSFSVWIFTGTLLRSLLIKHQQFVNTFMAAFLVYCAIMISGIVKYI